MATITDRRGNIIREEPDTLEDWKQAAEIEASIRREFQEEAARLRKLLTRAHQHLPLESSIRADVEAERPWRD